MGLVKDYQVPIETKGSDYKCTITIYDKSVEYDAAGLGVIIFRRPDDMPRPAAGDVLVINSAKIQSYRESISLITNASTSLHLYSAPDIPRPPRSAIDALRPPYSTRKLGDIEHEYVSWLYHHTDKDSVPHVATFQKLVDQSRKLRDKFCRLEDVVDSKFCDVIVNVVKAPFDQVDKTTLWVSDYTENDGFHKFIWNGAKGLEGRDGDPHGYLDTHSHTATNWAGPFGRRSMQVTCFGSHASQVKSDVQLGHWIRIRNLRIKFGNSGLNLEGVLHEDRDINRRQFDILKWDEGEDCDLHLKEAIRRKVEYEKLKKKQLKQFAENEGGEATGTKRKTDNNEEPKTNSKIRRKEKRVVAIKKAEEQDRQAEERLGLNKIIKCESQEQPITPVPFIIAPVLWETTVQGEDVTVTLPFACAKYRTNVRVVDFHPRKLENFATWRKSTESDVLSDYSSDSDSGSDDAPDGTLARYSGRKIWEWRFALQLEDADPKAKGTKDRFWVVVDNIEAQQLTGLDACDLREHSETLNSLREQLFKLWGNLEETKTEEHQRRIANQRRVMANQPPPSSPMNDYNEQRQHEPSGAKGQNTNGIEPSNKPFVCCIRQYGVCVRESDPHQADAGDGHRWMRMFGLFGTKITQ
ncbi:putative telomere-binding alpha subunit central domain-containing protein [Rosellinia necatrix]|uniref:Protection of telomeres protein 1 n=1 Tax=Rosellinia necatrix TaxID=77044 RepID=A0A1S7ULF5_ROSNE|nr:putative telomere-binding alpha subunit central domain-containing protein [Rosellinia necatrix]